MIEKIRISLWDVFTFFLTGLLAATTFLFLMIFSGGTSFREVAAISLKSPSWMVLVVGPVMLTLGGMLLEPVANYADRYVLKYVLGWATRVNSPGLKREEGILEREIKNNYLGRIGGEIDNPYHICKDYVEHKQLSSTFMVFLSRYGFYRNCSFITICAGVAYFFLSDSIVVGSIFLLSAIIVSIVFRRRAQEFYSYQAPSVYRAYLIDKLDWRVKDNGE